MVILTYKDLDAIAFALAFVVDEGRWLDDSEPFFRTRLKIEAAMREVEDFEPKPLFKIALESE